MKANIKLITYKRKFMLKEGGVLRNAGGGRGRIVVLPYDEYGVKSLLQWLYEREKHERECIKCPFFVNRYFMFYDIRFYRKRIRNRLRKRLRRFNTGASLKECKRMPVRINFVREESQQWLFERHFLGG